MRDFTPKFYLAALTLLLGLILMSTYLFRAIYTHQQELINVEENRYHSYLLTTQLRRSSDELTRLVRTYAVTGNPIYEKQFWDVLAIRNGDSPLPVHYDRVYWDFLAVENGTPPYALGAPVSLQSLMKSAGFTEDEFLLLKQSQKNSDNLVNLEMIAMNAMKGKYLADNGEFSISGTPDQEMAIELLHSDKYHNAKISIMEPINQFYEESDQRTKKHVVHTANELEFALNLQIFVFTLTVSFIFLLMLAAKIYHKRMVQTLNQRVDERTKELTKSNREIQKALDEVHALRGIIPICARCKKIRNDKGYWSQVDTYIEAHSEAKFSHGLCQQCSDELYGELDWYQKKEKKKKQAAKPKI